MQRCIFINGNMLTIDLTSGGKIDSLGLTFYLLCQGFLLTYIRSKELPNSWASASPS